jgi:hypothetical protein
MNSFSKKLVSSLPQNLPNQSISKNDKGRWAVEGVCRDLILNGHEVVKTAHRFSNQKEWRGAGECDVISWNGATHELWLLEVKYRPYTRVGLPLLSAKQLHRLRLAHRSLLGSLRRGGYLVQRRVKRSRFFLVWVKSMDPWSIEFLENP